MIRTVTARRAWAHLAVVAVSVALAGCAARDGAMRLGDAAAFAGDWDAAVAHFRQAVQEDPNDAVARISLERAMQAAARDHEQRARQFEAAGALADALVAYRQASKFDPTNDRLRQIAAELEDRLRETLEAAQAPSRIERLQAQATSPLPLLDPSSEAPLTLAFNDASLRDILDFMGDAAGINVIYDQQFTDRTYTIELDGVSLQEALDQILTANQLFFKVLNARSLIIVPDNPPKRSQYTEQVIRTFYVSHADVTELASLVTMVVRAPTLSVQPQIVANPTSNTITVRATADVAEVIARVIAANDKPPAEIVVDISILEVNRERAREFGLDLSQHSIGSRLSPAGTGSTFRATELGDLVNPSNLFLTVPTAAIDFLESDDDTRLVAKPQLRGQEGAEIVLNLGDEVPVPSTAFTAIATGGVAVNPLTSFEYRSVGVNVTMTPRVTFDDEIVLTLEVENSTLGPSINVAGQSLPTFGSRKFAGTLRLRDGEPNLLAGLLREEDRESLRGVPGLLRLPVLRQLLSANESRIKQTDIVMLLTPRIVRTHELTAEDVNPIYIGTAQEMSISGPPPLIAPVARPSEDGADDVPDPGVGRGGPEDAQPTAGDRVGDSRATRPALPTGDIGPQFGAQVHVAPPDAHLLVGRGPYSVPIAISGAAPMSTLSLRLTYDPAVLRVDTVEEGRFMQQGGAEVTFVHQVDAMAGRIDLVFTRNGDPAGAAGAGVVASVVFEPVARGSSTLAASGLGLGPEGAPVALGFAPATVSVR